MKINLVNVKNIELCYENCEVDTILQHNLLGIYIQRKLKPYISQNKSTDRIKTFEIVLKDINYSLRTDLAQLTVNYLDDSFKHFFIVWGKNDCSYDVSSLQKLHKQDTLLSLTSNCSSVFLK